jgi:hypothetical protein
MRYVLAANIVIGSTVISLDPQIAHTSPAPQLTIYIFDSMIACPSFTWTTRLAECHRLIPGSRKYQDSGWELDLLTYYAVFFACSGVSDGRGCIEQPDIRFA